MRSKRFVLVSIDIHPDLVPHLRPLFLSSFSRRVYIPDITVTHGIGTEGQVVPLVQLPFPNFKFLISASISNETPEERIIRPFEKPPTIPALPL